MFRIEMTTVTGERVLVGGEYASRFATRDDAERAMVMRRAEGEYTDRRGDAPNVTRVVECASEVQP